MRGSSSGAMPMPVSSTVTTASRPVACGAQLDAPAGAACISPRCPRGSRAPAAAGSDRRAPRHPPACRRESTGRGPPPDPRRGPRSAAPAPQGSAGSSCSRIVPVSASEMSIRVLSIPATRSDSSRQAARPSRSVGGIVRLQCRLGDPAQAGERCAEVVRHVVERPAHAGHDGVDPLEHGVEEHAQPAERVGGVADRHACVGAPGAKNLLHGRAKRVHRLQRRPCQQRAACEADDGDATRRARAAHAGSARAGPCGGRCSCRPGTSVPSRSRTDATSSRSPLPMSSAAHICWPLSGGVASCDRSNRRHASGMLTKMTSCLRAQRADEERFLAAGRPASAGSRARGASRPPCAYADAY